MRSCFLKLRFLLNISLYTNYVMHQNQLSSNKSKHAGYPPKGAVEDANATIMSNIYGADWLPNWQPQKQERKTLQKRMRNGI